MINLPASVYTAFHGYSWSRIPEGLTERIMDRLRNRAAAVRGEFPDPSSIEQGIVASGPVAAVYSIRTLPGWDSEGRAADYSAFLFFRAADAAKFDFGTLLGLPFLDLASRDVPECVPYDGGTAETSPLTAAGRLVCHRRLDSIPAVQCGDILAKYFTKSDSWLFRMNADGSMRIDCAEWKRRTEARP